MLSTTCTTLYTINVFLRSNGFLSFIYLGPACKQKYKYVTSMVTSGPGLSDSSHGFVRRSVKKKQIPINTHSWLYKSFVLQIIWPIRKILESIRFGARDTLPINHIEQGTMMATQSKRNECD